MQESGNSPITCESLSDMWHSDPPRGLGGGEGGLLQCKGGGWGVTLTPEHSAGKKEKKKSDMRRSRMNCATAAGVRMMFAQLSPHTGHRSCQQLRGTALQFPDAWQPFSAAAAHSSYTSWKMGLGLRRRAQGRSQMLRPVGTSRVTWPEEF